MAIIGKLLAITQDQLESLIANPDSIFYFLYPQDNHGIRDDVLDLGKSWHGIHFLLTGSDWHGDAPWSWTIMGGTSIGSDVGYGPARYLLPDQVQQVAEALTNQSRGDLAKEYVPKTMDKLGIYPGLWERDGKIALDYLLRNYDHVVRYYQNAVEKKQAMLFYRN